MRRLLAVIPVVLAALVVGFGAAWIGTDEPVETTTVDAYPRPLAPLPVPEIRLPDGPWSDPADPGSRSDVQRRPLPPNLVCIRTELVPFCRVG